MSSTRPWKKEAEIVDSATICLFVAFQNKERGISSYKTMSLQPTCVVALWKIIANTPVLSTGMEIRKIHTYGFVWPK
jgi:hypothetical protein